MKNNRKIISVILTICMIMQMLPVIASADNTETTKAGSVINYFINDQFETANNTDGWAHGVVNTGFEGIVRQTTLGEGENATGVLMVSNEGIEGYNAGDPYNGNQTVAIKSLPEISINSENSVVYLKTRVMHTSDSARFYMKFNRPNSVEKLPTYECSANLYTLFAVNKTSGMACSNGLNGDQVNAFANNLISGGLADNWIDVEMKLYTSGGRNLMHIKAIPTTGTGSDVTANLIQPERVYQTEYGTDTTKTTFDVLKTLAFTLRENTDTLYVDYVQGWVEYNKGEIKLDGSYAPGEGIKVGFDVSVNTAFTNAAEAVKLYDDKGNAVEASATVDLKNNTVTLLPKTDITEGQYYTVKVDESKLAENCKATFVSKRFYSSKTKYLVYEDFSAGNTGGWTLGDDTTGASLSAIEIPDDKGNYALTYNTTAANHLSGYASVAIPNAKFADNKEIVVKTRIKHTGPTGSATDGRLQFKFNRATYGDIYSEGGNSKGLLFRLNKDNLALVTGISNTGAWDHSAYTETTFPEYINVWFDVELRFTDDDTVKLTMKNGDVTLEKNLVMASGGADALNDLVMRIRDGNTVSMDYLQVYKVYETKMELDGSYAPGEEIKVSFNVPVKSAFINADEALKLYDASGNVVKTTVTADDNTITLLPENDITEGQYYTIKVDESKLTDNCIFEIKEKQFYASKMKYIIYDDFNNGKLGNWKLGKTTVASDNYEYGVKDGAMYLNLKTANMTPDIPTLINDFKNVAYEEGKKIVVKAKVKSTGSNGNHRSYLKLNRPDNPNLPANEQNAQWYAIGTLRGDGYQITDPNLHQSGQWVYQVTSGNIQNQWLEVETVLDGVNANAVTTVTHNGTSYGPKTGTLKENTTDYAGAYEAAGVDPKVGFTSFDSLTWVPRSANGITTGHEMAIDYIYAYELAPVNQLLTKDVVDVDEDIIIKLDKNIYNVADGAVVLKNEEGVAVQVVTVAVDKNTITLHHDGELAEGKYKVVFGDSQSTGVIFETAELALTVKNIETDGFIIDQQFNTEGSAEGWVYAPTTDNLYNATVSQTTKDDYGVLMIKAAADMSAGNENGLSAAHFDLADDIVFKAGAKIRIKTRFYHETDRASTNSRVAFKYNRPFALADQDPVEAGYNLGMLFIEHTGSLKVKDGQWDGPQDASKDILANAANKWLDFEMTLDFVNNSAEYSVKETGSTEAPVTTTGTLKTKNASDALESLAVLFRGTPSTMYFDYIQVSEVKSVTPSLAKNTIFTDEDIVIDVDEEIDSLTDGAIVLKNASGDVVEGVSVTNNKNRKTITIHSETALASGEYKVVFDNSISADLMFTVGELTINIVDKEAKGIVVNQQFNTEGSAEGWVYAPTTNNNYNATVEQATKDGYGVLKIKAADNMPAVGHQGLSAAHFDLADDIIFKSGAKIHIKTRFYHETDTSSSDTRVSFKYNRPFALAEQDPVEAGYNLGMLFIENTGSLKVKDGQWDGPQDASKDILANAANKWLDFEMTLDFVNNSAEYSVKETGSTEAPVTTTGTLKTKHPSDALESLAVLFRGTPSTMYFDYITIAEIVEAKAAIDAKDIAKNASIGAHLIGTNGEIADFSEAVTLVDADENEVTVTKSFVKEKQSAFDSKRDVKVVLNPVDNLEVGKIYTVKFDEEKLTELGLTLSGEKQFTFNVISSKNVDIDFEDSNITTWAFREDTLGNVKTATVVDDGTGNKYLRINVNGNVTTGAGQLVTYEKIFDQPFVRNMEGNTVVEMKIKTNKNEARKYVKLNYPASAGELVGDKTENLYNEFAWNTRLAAVMNNNNLGITYHDYYFDTLASEYANYYQGKVKNVTTYNTDEWYTVKTVYNNAAGTASTYVYGEDNKLIDSSENNELSAWWYGYADFNRTKPEIMHTINSISLQFRPGNGVTTLSNEQFDIDNIRIYNEANVKTELTVNGNSISTFDAGEIVKPKFTLYPESDTDTSYVAISAMYIGGILEDLHIKEITTTGEVYVEENGYTVPDKEDVVIKAFIWDSLDTMRPVGKTAKAAKAADQFILYVDAYKGNDGNGSGDINSPVASLGKALEIASTVNSEETEKVEIIVNNGTYHLNKTVSVNSANHVTDELVIKAADGANPTFVNGITFKISDAVKVNDTSITSRLVDQTAAGNLYEIDLTKKVALDDIPGVSLPGAYSYSMSWIEESETPTSEMFFDGKPMTIARYPNESEGYTAVSRVVNRGAVPRNWEADRVGTDKYVEPANQNRDDVFVIESTKANNWTQADQALMFGYWEFDWATQTVPLKKAENGQLTAKYPSYYGVTAGQRYYIFNLLEEIDVPGEYFIDRNTGKMYFYMPENAEADDEITMSLSAGSMLDITADNTIIDGLVFTASRGKGVTISANNVTVKNSTISNTADMAVEINGKNNTVENCVIHDVDGGVKVTGGSNADFTTGENRILNNDISRFARLSKVYTYAIELLGCGNTASNNNIYNSEHSALTFSGTNHTISYNDIHDVCKEVNDAGAIYVGRTWVSRDNNITNNYIHDISSSASQGEPISGVFFDDHFAGIIIKNNVFANIEGYGARGNKGRESDIANNIFVNCTLGGVKISAEYFPSESSYSTQISTVTPYLNNELWKNKYEILFTADKTAVNTSELIKGNYNKCTNNLLVNCADGVEIPNNILATGNVAEGNYNTTQDPGFESIESGDFRIDNSIIQSLITGFTDVQFEKMGRK